MSLLWLSVQSVDVLAKGNLSAGAEEITIHLGSEESDYALEPRRIKMETGQSYRLEFVSRGFKEYVIHAPEFFNNVWVRVVESQWYKFDHRANS